MKLLDARADVNLAKSNGIPPLTIAAVQNHHAVTKLLLRAGGDESAATAAAEQYVHGMLVSLLIEAIATARAEIAAETVSSSAGGGQLVPFKKKCARCGTSDRKLKKCAGCKHVYYCCLKCQKAAWPDHKGECRKIRKAIARVVQI